MVLRNYKKKEKLIDLIIIITKTFLHPSKSCVAKKLYKFLLLNYIKNFILHIF